MKLPIQFLTLTIAMAALTISQAKLGGSGMRNLQSGQCEICSSTNKNRPDYLSLQYVPQGVASMYQDSSKATCVQGSYPTSTNVVVTNKDNFRQVFDLQAGTVFRIDGPFDAETDFYFGNNGDCFIHTSCSVPLVAGDQIGPFKVLAGTGCTSGVGGIGQTQPAPSTCEICSSDNKNKPDYLKLEYSSDGKNSGYQDSSKATCIQGPYPESTTLVTTNKDDRTQIIPVEDGTVFEISGEFESETVFNFPGGSSCFIHTSCSVPLVAGDQIGPFKVLAGTDCPDIGQIQPEPILPEPILPEPILPEPSQPEPSQPEPPCEICSSTNKNKPVVLTLLYKPAGKNSVYQDEIEATCREAMYPTDTNIATTNRDGDVEIFHVEDGTVFVITGKFEDATVFKFMDESSCFIQTSCSAPLVAGDQIGPFVVLEGNDCKYSTSSPSAQPSPSPSAQPTGTPSAPPTTGPSPSPSAPPTTGPSPSPSAPPTAGPSPSPSAPPTPGPSPSPSAPPTTGPSPSPSAPPTTGPSPAPSVQPTGTPSTPPTMTSPSAQPTGTPSTPPTTGPSPSPSAQPSPSPSAQPTSTPSTPPTPGPSLSPSVSAQPTGTPSTPPTPGPSLSPSASAQPSDAPSTPPTLGPSPSPSNSPSTTPSMTPTKASCVEVNENNYAEGDDIVVSYNINFNEANPLLAGLICIYPCSNIDCEDMTLACGNPAPTNCANTDSTGEHVFTAQTSMQADGSTNRCFKAVVFRNEAGTTPAAQCCSEDFIVGFEAICLA